MQSIVARRSGWQTALDVLVAPRAAFANLREAPTWVWAFLVSTALGMVCAIAISPAFAHALSLELPARLAANPQIAQLPAPQRESVIARQVSLAQAATRFTFVFVPIGLALGSAFQALIMLIANALGNGDGDFKRFWALAVNAALTGTGVSSVVLLLIVLIRGANRFAASSDITTALPGLGMLVPASAKLAAAYFGVINAFVIWNMVLLAIGMTIVARLPRPLAVATALVMLLGTGLFPLIGASFQR